MPISCYVLLGRKAHLEANPGTVPSTHVSIPERLNVFTDDSFTVHAHAPSFFSLQYGGCRKGVLTLLDKSRDRFNGKVN